MDRPSRVRLVYYSFSLKAKNILIHEGDVVVADFGVSKQLNKQDDLTQTYAGSPYNMAPEVLKKEEYGTEIDIYRYSHIYLLFSLGVIMYDLIYPDRIFDCKNI